MTGPDVDITWLRYFQAIARWGSMTTAARQLRVSQPTLTVAMRKLEQTLSTTLFLRDRTGVQLTSSGRELMRTAEEVFGALERAEKQIHGLESEDVGRFVIGCPDVLGCYFLPELLGSVLAAAPRIDLVLWNAPSRSVQEAVLSREVDFGLIVNRRPHADLVVKELFDDTTELFVRAGGRRTSPQVERFLLEGPLIYVDQLPQSQEMMNRLAKRQLLPERRVPCGNLQLVKSLALAEVGIAILPRRVADYDTNGRLARLHSSLPSIPDTICLIFRADLHKTRAAVRIKDALLAHGARIKQAV
jgi:DNA-binding transcriptional LysR family regulator